MDCPSYTPHCMGPGLYSFYPDLHQQEQQCPYLVPEEPRAERLPHDVVLPTRGSMVAGNIVISLEIRGTIPRLRTHAFVVRE